MSWSSVFFLKGLRLILGQQDSARLSQTQPDLARLRLSQTQPDSARLSQPQPDSARLTQTHPDSDSARLSQTQPDSARLRLNQTQPCSARLNQGSARLSQTQPDSASENPTPPNRNRRPAGGFGKENFFLKEKWIFLRDAFGKWKAGCGGRWAAKLIFEGFLRFSQFGPISTAVFSIHMERVELSRWYTQR